MRTIQLASIALLLVGACLAGCGQKGPLYLPEAAPAAQAEPTVNAPESDDEAGDKRDADSE